VEKNLKKKKKLGGMERKKKMDGQERKKKKKKKVTYCLASGRSPSAIGTIDVMWVSGP
jgi:hypothetical protein